MTTVFDAQSPEFQKILEEVYATAVKRDLNRRSIQDAVTALKRIGIGGARLPKDVGGAGLSLPMFFDVIFRIAKADSNVAHVLRNHFQFVEGLSRPDMLEVNRTLIDRAVSGELFGTAYSEDNARPAGSPSFDVALTVIENGFRLDGDKIYSTGNLYVDTIVVSAGDGNGTNVFVLVPAHREGVQHLDDWDGIGQRLTGSGTTRFEGVRVSESEILRATIGSRVRPYGSTFVQLWLTTIVAAILQRAISDMIDVVRQRRRNYYHGLAQEPRQDPIVQQTLGQLAAQAYVAEAAVRDAASRLERAWQSGGGVKIDIDLARDASLAALKSKIVVDGIAQWVTSELYEIGGASATAKSKDLDRHWRNVRTLSSHNPKAYKARVLGDYLLNDVPPPDRSYF